MQDLHVSSKSRLLRYALRRHAIQSSGTLSLCDLTGMAASNLVKDGLIAGLVSFGAVALWMIVYGEWLFAHHLHLGYLRVDCIQQFLLNFRAIMPSHDQALAHLNYFQFDCIQLASFLNSILAIFLASFVAAFFITAKPVVFCLRWIARGVMVVAGPDSLLWHAAFSIWAKACVRIHIDA